MIQSAAREGGGAYTGSNPAIVRGAGSRDHEGSCLTRSHPHAGVGASASGAVEDGAIHQGAFVAKIAGGVSRTAQEVLGAAHVGARLLLRDGGRGR